MAIHRQAVTRRWIQALLALVMATATMVVTFSPQVAAAATPDCATAPGNASCGYYITGVDGSRELVGTNTVSPSVISAGTSVVQTATVALVPHEEQAGGHGAVYAAMSVRLGSVGPITDVSP